MFETVCAVCGLAALWLYVIHKDSKSFWAVSWTDRVWSVVCVVAIAASALYFLSPFWTLFKRYFAIPYGY